VAEEEWDVRLSKYVKKILSVKTPESLLKKHWSHDQFRSGQKEVIDSVLSGRDAIVLFPTGGGKSITFQIPGLILPGLALVISPIISLIKDQVNHLHQKNIIADYITSDRNREDVIRIFDNIIFGKTKFLYIAPERLDSELFIEKMKQVNVSLIAIDEAHCVSLWGHDFRPAYLELHRLKTYFPKATIMALTATATPKVISDIQEILEMEEPVVFRKSFLRDNLALHVIETEKKFDYIRRILSERNSSGIIYCKKRSTTEELVHKLRQHNFSAEAYHAGMTSKQRTTIQNKWTKNKVKTIVATSAFGMGIDKADVRTVIHHDLPNSIEEYYQEAGRAGRDGNMSKAFLLYNKSEIVYAKKMLSSRFPDIKSVFQLYNTLLNFYEIALYEGEGLEKIFNFQSFCESYNFKRSVAIYQFKVLVDFSFIAFSDKKETGSVVRILLSRKEVELVSGLLENETALLSILLRTYEGLFFTDVKIDEDLLSKKLYLKTEEIEKTLQQLRHKGIIKYNKISGGNKIKFLKNRSDQHARQFDQKKYDIKKSNEGKKLLSIIDLVTDNQKCRQWRILDYFEDQKKKDCGICDLCQIRSKSISSKDILRKLSKGKYTIQKLVDSFEPYFRNQILEEISTLEDQEVIFLDNDLIIQVN
jgi:ATP-dependent DNA helicase RecQ